MNARHGNEPGVAFYTHISDQFGPFHTKVIAAAASEAPHVLDGLLSHRSGLQIREHYTDTGGATDHVFGLCPFLGFRFAPRLRDIKDRRIYLLPGMTADPVLEPLVGRRAGHEARGGELGRTRAPCRLHPRRHHERLGHAPEAGGLPAPERPGRRPP